VTLLTDRPVDVGPDPDGMTTQLPSRRKFGRTLVKWITSTDHKVIGYMYLMTTFVFFLFGGVLALMIRAELAQPGLQFFSQEQYNSCSRCTARSCCCCSRRRCSQASPT
jgi:hypothetical protein